MMVMLQQLLQCVKRKLLSAPPRGAAWSAPRGSYLLRALILSSTLFILSACDTPDPECIYAGEYGNVRTADFTISPTAAGNQSTGIYVPKGAFLRIQTTGMIDICRTAAVVPYTPSARNGAWQNSQVYVEPLNYLQLAVSNSYSRWWGDDACSKTAAYVPAYWNDTCYATEGRGLFTYISLTNPGSVTGLNHTLNADVQFFELYDRTLNRGGFTGFSPVAGYLWFHYDDGPEPYATKKHLMGDFSNNRPVTGGGYTVNITKRCTGFMGKYVQAIITDADDATSTTNIDLHALSNPVDIGIYYTETAPANGYLSFKVLDIPAYGGNNNYSTTDNIGSYAVKIHTLEKDIDDIYSAVLNMLIDPIRDLLFDESGSTVSMTHRMYSKLIPAPDVKQQEIVTDPVTGERELQDVEQTSPAFFVEVIQALLILYIVFYALGFIMGMSGTTTRMDFVIRLVKMAVIVQLISPTSWEFFNETLFKIFIDGLDEMITIVAGQFSSMAAPTGATATDAYGAATSISTAIPDLDDPFAFINLTLTEFFSEETFIRIFSLILSHVLGLVYAIIIIITMIFYGWIIIRAAVLYLLALIGISLLIGLAPIFITCLLFEFTKGAFDSWMKMLINFFLQPVFLFTVLAIFNIFIYATLFNMLNFDVCWDCLVHLDFLEDWGLASPAPCLFSFYMPTGLEGEDVSADSYFSLDLPISLFQIITFIIVVHAMMHFAEWATQVSQNIAVGVAGSSALAGAARLTIANALGMPKEAMGKLGALAEVSGTKDLAKKAYEKISEEKGGGEK